MSVTALGPIWDPRIRTLLLLTVLTIPMVTWIAALGNPLLYFQSGLPPGQALYSLSKLAGLYAIVLLWLQVLYGVGKNIRPGRDDRRPWSFNAHRLLGISTLAAVLMHFLFFFSAVSVRTNNLPLNLLVPDLGNGFYAAAVSLGWFALVGMLLVAMSGLLRSKTKGGWIWVHRFSFLVIALGLVHAQLVGSEAQANHWFYLTLFFGGTVLAALMWRMRAGHG
ncbi:MAG: hypothetical protein J5I92_01560 [Thiogranum sp.]|nr:hypothetical protein [Thiogranum sp.]